MGKKRNFTDEDRRTVRWMAIAGIPQERIAKTLDTTKSTLEKYFREELTEASDKANSAIVGSLYKNAIEGNVVAQIFWCKTRLKWREMDRVEHTGADGAPLTPVFNIHVRSTETDNK